MGLEGESPSPDTYTGMCNDMVMVHSTEKERMLEEGGEQEGTWGGESADR